jgi:hypothetical protein
LALIQIRQNALKKLQSARTKRIDTCVGNANAKQRVDDAFTNAFAAYVKGTVALYPPGFGPKFSNSSGTVVDPFNNSLALASIGLNLFLFPSRYQRFLGSLAYATSASSSSAKSLDRKLAGNLDIAWSRPFGTPDADGYTPSWGIGIGASFEKCFEKNGCSRTDIPGYTTTKAPVDWFAAATLYAFVRLKSKVEFQLSVPFNNYLLATPIDATDTHTTVFEVVPTLTASVATWTVGQIPAN